MYRWCFICNAEITSCKFIVTCDISPNKLKRLSSCFFFLCTCQYWFILLCQSYSSIDVSISFIFTLFFVCLSFCVGLFNLILYFICFTFYCIYNLLYCYLSFKTFKAYECVFSLFLCSVYFLNFIVSGFFSEYYFYLVLLLLLIIVHLLTINV